jgi:hypothetical protein
VTERLTSVYFNLESGPALSRVQAALLASEQTLQSFELGLATLVSASPELAGDVLAQCACWGHFVLYRAREGKLTRRTIEERTADRFAEPLQFASAIQRTTTLAIAQDYAGICSELGLACAQVDAPAGVLEIPRQFAFELRMRATLDRIARALVEGEAHRWVATAGAERFLVELRTRTANVRRLVFVNEDQRMRALLYPKAARSALAAAAGLLSERGKGPVSARPPESAPPIVIVWREEILEAVEEEAFLQQQSVAAVLQEAWANARVELALHDAAGLQHLLIAHAVHNGAPDRTLTPFLGSAMFAELKTEAARTETSVSMVIQCAWVIARPKISILPPPVAF